MSFQQSWSSRQRGRSVQNTLPGRFLRFEGLESRVLLDGDGFLTGTDVYLSLSFAADGTEIAGQANSIASIFDTIAPRSEWQDAILRAFQTWAVHTNADIGLRSDNGDPFGAPGRNQQDDRFGDIRIGAIEMSPEVGAVSVPVDGLVSGTWFADVVFNSSFDYQTLDDIYAVALHEAGNVFGLADNNDPDSPLFTGSNPTGLPPTTADITNLQRLHGARFPDFNETERGGPDNDSFANATRIKLLELDASPEGSVPSFVYGDISTVNDKDIFKLVTPADYTGSVTFQLRSSGISLLTPTITLFDQSRQQVDQAISASTTGDTLTLTIPSVSPDQTYFIDVEGSTTELYGVGGYSLVTIFDGINQVDQTEIDALAGGQFRFLEPDDFEDFFEVDDDDLLREDFLSNETFATATEIDTAPGFVDGSRYEVVGSISNASDVDFYTLKSPEAVAPPPDVMTVVVRSLEAGGLTPLVSVFDDNDQIVPLTIIANGGGDLIVQASGIAADKDYAIKIEAQNPNGLFNTGNYSLDVAFGTETTQLTPMSAGTVGDGTTQNLHTLYVGQPQLFHFALQIDPATVSSPTAVVATIDNELGETVYEIAARPGETRSREAVLLAPGEYSVKVAPYSLDGSTIPALSYSLLGTSISDLFVGDPSDPNAHPFECTEPGLEGFFCYPGDFVSPDPFLWDNFIDSTSTPPDQPDLPSLVSAILGDWWSWVWEQAGVNGPPLGVSDTTHVPSAPLGAVSLFVGPNGSVLDNDIDPENGAIVAILQAEPEHGSLVFANDGTFTYTPNPGFQGRDSFTYVASDFSNQSATTTVSIIVGESGDFDADGDTDGTDFLTWQRNYGMSETAVLVDGDSNFDNAVDAADLAFWQSRYPIDQFTISTDFDSDGDTDGVDFLTWQRNAGTPSGATPDGGDSDSDGDVDQDDLINWSNGFGQGTVVATAVSEKAESPLAASFAQITSSERLVAIVSQKTEQVGAPIGASSIADPPASAYSYSIPARRERFRSQGASHHDRVFAELGEGRTQTLREEFRPLFATFRVGEQRD